MTSACSIRVRGVVQGVGFRPFVYRLARANTLAGWVLNGDEGVEIHLEGDHERVEAFLRELRTDGAGRGEHHRHRRRLPRSRAGSTTSSSAPAGRATSPRPRSRPTWRCARAVSRELFDPADPRYRLSLYQLHRLRPALLDHPARLPYDRAAHHDGRVGDGRGCARRVSRPGSRRFHAQPVACPSCGPRYRLLRTMTDDAATGRRGGDRRRAAATCSAAAPSSP